MTLSLVPLFVNEVPSINSDNHAITYNLLTQRVYQVGLAASGDGSVYLTEQNGETGELLQSVLFSSSMPISSNFTFNLGALGIKQIVTNPSGTFLYSVTENNVGGNRGISRWDVSDLTEDAHVNPSSAIGGTHDTPILTFLLDGIEYVITVYSNRIFIVNAATMVAVVDTSWSVTGQIYYILVGEQPTSTTQVFYVVTHSGTRLRVYKNTFNKELGSISSSTLLLNWLSTNVDAAWPGGFSSNPQPFLPMFDSSDNNLILIVNQSGSTGSATTGAYLLKINTTTGAIVWQLAVPRQYAASPTSSISAINGILRFLPGDETADGFSYPWSDPPAGVVLLIDTSDGSYTEELYSEAAGFPGFGGSLRANIYFSDEEYFLIYDPAGTNGFGNGWLAFAFGEPPVSGTIGGSGMQLEPMGCIVTAQPYALEVRGINSIIELGPFRFVEQKESDETSMITTLILGLTEVDTGLLVEIDLSTASDLSNLNQVFGATVDLGTQVDVLSDDVEIDMGEGVDNSDDFTLELLGNDDGSTYPGPPIEFKPEVLSPIDDRGSTKQYSPTGYSFIYHRVRLKATEIDEKFQVKFVDISGQLTGRLF